MFSDDRELVDEEELVDAEDSLCSVLDEDDLSFSVLDEDALCSVDEDELTSHSSGIDRRCEISKYGMPSGVYPVGVWANTFASLILRMPTSSGLRTG